MDTKYDVSWTILVLVLFLAIAALAGIVQAPLKRIAASAKTGQDAGASVGKVQTLSTIILILFLAILWLMQSPW
jgi:hypothetical protein